MMLCCATRSMISSRFFFASDSHNPLPSLPYTHSTYMYGVRKVTDYLSSLGYSWRHTVFSHFDKEFAFAFLRAFLIVAICEGDFILTFHPSVLHSAWIIFRGAETFCVRFLGFHFFSPSSSSVHFFITSSPALCPSPTLLSPANRPSVRPRLLTALIIMFSIFVGLPTLLASVRSFPFLIFGALISLYFISIYIVTTSIDKNTVSRASNGRNSFQLSSSLSYSPFTTYFWCHCHSSYFHFHSTHSCRVQLSSSM